MFRGAGGLRIMMVVPLLLAAGCSSTGPVRDPEPDGPRGWLYMRWGNVSHSPPARIDVATGRWEALELPTEIDGSTWSMFDHVVSPVTGEFTGAARRLSEAWRPTFIADPATGTVSWFRPPGVPVGDDRHVWAPDGSAVMFLRRQLTGGGYVWVRLDAATGRQDTLMTTPQPINAIFWFGPDTMVFYRLEVGGYQAYAWPQGTIAQWDLVPWSNFHPVVSADRRWIAYWSSARVQGSDVELYEYYLHLLDRERGSDTIIQIGRQNETAISRAFSPDSRYLAHCPTPDSVAIVEVKTAQRIKAFPVIFCFGLSWSWGLEGPPVD